MPPQNVLLCEFGIHPSSEKGYDPHARPNSDEVSICAKWLSEFAAHSSRWTERTSYGYKHDVEKWTELVTGTRKYISNGAFILAAGGCGYDWARSSRRSPNAIFKMRSQFDLAQHSIANAPGDWGGWDPSWGPVPFTPEVLLAPCDNPYRENRHEHTGQVYLIKGGPYYKIGASKVANKRFAQLSTASPFPLKLEHSITTWDMFALEHRLHKRFAPKRKNGEWFELDDSDVEYIKGL